MAHRTNGEYYYANTAKELISYFLTVNMGEKYDIITDTDEDGIPDLFETYGMPVANGQVLFSDPENKDTDGDGLEDGEEVIMHIVDDADEVKATYNYMYDYIPDIFISENGGIYFTMVADPENADTDNDGIIDGNEVVNITADERYDNLNPLVLDTIQTLFPELTDSTGSNQENNAIYIDINENNITICPRILFSGDYDTRALDVLYWNEKESESVEIINRLGTDCTLGNLFIDGLKERWGGEYAGSVYDFYPGINIQVSVSPEIITKESVGADHYISVTMHPTLLDSSYTYIQRKTNGNRTMVLTRGFDENSIKTPAYYEGTSAHEFGHTILLSDAYSSANSGYQPISATEIYYNDYVYGMPSSGEVMMHTGRAITNDIEMTLVGYSENSWQSFVPSKSYSLSSAIKETQVYRKASKLYTWDNEQKAFVEFAS